MLLKRNSTFYHGGYLSLFHICFYVLPAWEGAKDRNSSIQHKLVPKMQVFDILNYCMRSLLTLLFSRCFFENLHFQLEICAHNWHRVYVGYRYFEPYSRGQIREFK